MGETRSWDLGTRFLLGPLQFIAPHHLRCYVWLQIPLLNRTTLQLAYTPHIDSLISQKKDSEPKTTVLP